MPETLTDLLYGAWLGTTGMCLLLGNEFHMDALCLSAMHACYVCWLTFDVARGQGLEVRTIFAFG